MVVTSRLDYFEEIVSAQQLNRRFMCFEIFMPDVRETEISLTMFFPGKKKHKITLPPHDFKVYNLKS